MASIETAQDQELQLDQIISDDEVHDITFDSLNTEEESITEKEKQEYLKLNNRYTQLMIKARSNRLTDDDEKIFKEKGISYIVTNGLPVGKPAIYNGQPAENLGIYSKSNDYRVAYWLTIYVDSFGGSRPKLVEPRTFVGSKSKETLNIDQYKKTLDKIETILNEQSNYLENKKNNIKEEKDKEIDDIISNL